MKDMKDTPHTLTAPTWPSVWVHGSDVRHLLRTGRWADGDPAEDMGDDAWYDLVAAACRIEALAEIRGGAA